MRANFVRDCKPFPAHWWSFPALILIAVLISISPTLADEPDRQQVKVPPPLSLESLFHPDKRFDYDGKLPTVHWIGDEPAKLLVRREQTWNELNLESGQETPWPVVTQLAEQLGHLQGVDDKQAMQSAMSVVSKMEKPDETVLVNIDKSLAIVSAMSPARWLTRDSSGWQNAMIDPSARRVAYTRGGDLFVVDVKTDRSLQLTNDGTDTLLDGVLDWTYQEEIFGRGNFRGFWFSPDGQWLAMMRIDISDVQPYVLSAASSDRGKGVVSRYPKAGDPIPQAELYLWDLRDFDEGNVPLPKLIAQSTPQDEQIITGVWWHPHTRGLVFCVSDRLQTWRELRALDENALPGPAQGTRLLIREESPAWIEPPSSPAWMADGSLVWQSELPSGRPRLYHISSNGQAVTPVSPEDFDVRGFMVSEDASFAIVTGDRQRQTIERHAYRIDLLMEGAPSLCR